MTQRRQTERVARSVARSKELWTGRYAAARSQVALAAVEWDRLRAAVARLPEADRPAWWRETRRALRDVRSRLEDH